MEGRKKGLYFMTFCFWIAVVASRNKVSWGAILWKTTFEMEDLPLLLASVSLDDKDEALNRPFEPHEQHFWLVLAEPHGGKKGLPNISIGASEYRLTLR